MINKNIKTNILDIDDIVERFICPACQDKLVQLDSLFKCTNCNMEYPILNNIPVLINESDSLFSIKQHISDFSALKYDKNKKLKKLIRKFIPSLSNNLSSKNNFSLLKKLLKIKNKPKILIIGGGEITVDTDMLFKSNNIIVESDIYFGDRTSIIIDSHYIPFEDETFDLIIFQAVLEHVVDPKKCVNEAYRVLKSDGLVFATTPFMQGVHMKANDFTRFTHLGHRKLFQSFTEIESGVFAGSGVALGWSIRYFAKSLTNNKLIRLFLEVFVSYLFFWLKYIDYLTVNNKGTYDGASGFYFIGKKNDSKLNDKDLIKLFRGIGK